MRHTSRKPFLAAAFFSLAATLSLPMNQGALARKGGSKLPRKELRARRNLQQQLRKIYRKKAAREGTFALQIKLLNGPVIFARNGYKRLHPASCMKLLTSATVLRKLTPKYRFDTVLAGDRHGDTLKSPLYLWGQGDPSLTHDDLAKMAAELAGRGVKKIPKGIRVDDSYFVHRRFPPGFGRPSPKSYIAPTGAVSINGNTVTVDIRPEKKGGKCTASVTVRPPSDHVTLSSSVRCRQGKSWLRVAAKKKGKMVHIIARGSVKPDASPFSVRRRVFYPSLYAGETLKHLLQAKGVKVGKVARGKKPPTVKTLTRHRSKPLQEIVTHMNRFSDNHYAEQLLKVVGAKTMGTPGSTKKGLEVVRRFLARAGVKRNHYVLANGSGLFANTRLSPKAIVKFLQRVSTLKWLQDKLVASLPLAGRNGTLAHRMDGTAAEGSVRAKTGTLRSVSTLSGYVLDRKKRPVVLFSILHNGIKGSVRRSRALQDEITKALSKYVDAWR